jgi:hypothetical protein
MPLLLIVIIKTPNVNFGMLYLNVDSFLVYTDSVYNSTDHMSSTRHSSPLSATTCLPDRSWRLSLVHSPGASSERSTRCLQAGAGDPFPSFPTVPPYHHRLPYSRS